MAIGKPTPLTLALRNSILAVLLCLPLGLLADVLVVTGAMSPSVSLNKSQVRDVFLGKLVSLPDGSRVAPLDQPESSPLREEFYAKIANKSAAQAKAHWAILHFTGRGVPPHECADSNEVKKTLNATPGAIGYIDPASLDDSVKVVFDAP